MVFLSDLVVILDRKLGRTKQLINLDLPRPRTEELSMLHEFLEEKRRLYDVLSET